MEFVTALTSILASTGMATVAAAWITRTWLSRRIQHDFDRKLEAYRAQLQSTHTVEVERLRNDLANQAFERQLRFTKLQEHRVQAIATTYGLLQELAQSVRSSLGMGPGAATNVERQERMHKAFAAFDKYFWSHSIWLPTADAGRVEDLLNRLWDAAYRLGVSRMTSDKGQQDELWKKTLDDLKGGVDPLLVSLADEFRRLMGEYSDRPQSDSRNVPGQEVDRVADIPGTGVIDG